MQENTEFHIGNIICEHLKTEGRSKKWLAKRVNYTHSALCKVLKNKSIHTDVLLRISIACKYNFAEHISNYYKANSGNQ